MKRKNLGVDPEYHRYRRSYPKFPGVKVCVDLLRRRNVHGAYLDGVMGDLAEHVADAGTTELVETYRAETDDVVQGLILSILAETASAGGPAAVRRDARRGERGPPIMGCGRSPQTGYAGGEARTLGGALANLRRSGRNRAAPPDAR
jgi:hypothetical protein